MASIRLQSVMLPQEIKERIFILTSHPQELSMASQHFNRISKDGLIRAKWIFTNIKKLSRSLQICRITTPNPSESSNNSNVQDHFPVKILDELTCCFVLKFLEGPSNRDSISDEKADTETLLKELDEDRTFSIIEWKKFRLQLFILIWDWVTR